MPKEIERKFLVSDDTWRRDAERAKQLKQAYLASTEAASVRVRIVEDDGEEKAFLTIKTASAGMSRDEFEYEIPVADAVAMLEMRDGGLIEKVRYVLPCADGDLTVDEFSGSNEGLVVAEIELANEAIEPALPAWIGREITGDRRFYNASLAGRPYADWPDEDRA